jgi:murein DD-endopeptidase MepM/ murein hydrolase activator NlpD
MPGNLPIMLLEGGIDEYTKDPKVQGERRGWRAWKLPSEYAAQIYAFIITAAKDPRFVCFTPFTSDGAREWHSFDVEPAYSEILKLDWDKQTEEPDVPPQPPVPPPTPVPGKNLLWPCKGPVTQRFGENYDHYMEVFGIPGHNGIDIGAALGTPILAIADGEVKWVAVDDNYGIYVRLYHPQHKLHSFYAHMERATAPKLGTVRRGDIIGYVGSTGNSTGPHLHFEIRCGGPDTYAHGAYGHTKGRVDPETVYYLLGEK